MAVAISPSPLVVSDRRPVVGLHRPPPSWCLLQWLRDFSVRRVPVYTTSWQVAAFGIYVDVERGLKSLAHLVLNIPYHPLVASNASGCNTHLAVLLVTCACVTTTNLSRPPLFVPHAGPHQPAVCRPLRGEPGPLQPVHLPLVRTMETRELASRAQVMLLVGRWVLFKCLATKRSQRFLAVLDELINTWPPNYVDLFYESRFPRAQR